MNQFIKELNRRNVFRMAVLYAIAAWVIMQVAEVLNALASLPDWVGPAVLGLLAVGFPIALILSWFYEITPAGISLEKDVDRAASITHVTGRRLDFIVISLLAAAVILFAYDKWWIGGPAQQSIAVLPFVNMSDDASNEYFSDGISEELLNMLAKVPDFHVVGRTSSFSFKGKDQDLREIAQKLGVTHILEGSVRKAGNQVRITAQLVQAEDGFYLWSETYDRELEDIFAIQDEIAQNIVSALQATLGTAPAGLTVGRQPTESLEAYELYLQGRYLWFQRSIENIGEGIRLLEQAVELDPEFAQAWATLGVARVTLPFYTLTSRAETDRLAEQAARRALELDETLGEAWATLAARATFKDDWLGALEFYRKAVEIAPNDPTVRLWYGNTYFCAGYLEQALPQIEMAVRLDPVSGTNNDWLARIYDALGHDSDAEATFERSIALGRGPAAAQLGWYLVEKGREAEAIELRRSRPDFFSDESTTSFEQTLLARSEPSLKTQTMEYMAGLPFAPSNAYKMYHYVVLGEYDLAMQNIRRIAEFDNTIFTMFWYPRNAALRQHPDFPELMRDAGFVELWEAEGYPEMCHPAGNSFECD